MRLWLDVLKDRRIVALRARLKDADLMRQIDEARAEGDLNGMLKALVKYNGDSPEKPARLYADWTKGLRDEARFRRQEVGYRFLNDKGNVCWESLTNAYRIYNGQFDLYAKYDPQLITRINWGNYHREQPWGMDCLLLGETPAWAAGAVHQRPALPGAQRRRSERPGEIHFTASRSRSPPDTGRSSSRARGSAEKELHGGLARDLPGRPS